jgi:hypothetical protein
MPSDPQRVEQLTLAGSFCLFDKKLRSSGKSSIVWGLLNLFLGTAVIAAHSNWGAVSLFLGVALIVVGVYQRKVRDPYVIVISAATLAALALWNFALIGLAAMGKMHLALGGRTLYWAIAQAWGAYATWTTYSTYKMLREKSDPLTVQRVREYLDELKKTKPEQSLDLIQFDVNAGFVGGTKQYRLKPVEDLYLAARYRSQFGSCQLEEVGFVPRSEVTLTLEGEKWISKKVKAIVQLGPLKLDKVSITPDMASRISPTARLMSFSTT